jgi:hypothetical protein
MIKEDSDSNLEKLRGEYGKFKDRYNLPEFSRLNEIFDIEEIECDSEFLLRKIRRIASERIAGYLRFIEIILNPSNAPMFFFKLIKKLEENDKNILNDVYELLGKFEVEVIALDLEYNEKKEADFIKKSYEALKNNVSRQMLGVVSKMGNGQNQEKKEEKGSYFG